MKGSGRVLGEKFKGILGEFWENSGRILGKFWGNSGKVLGKIWGEFWGVFWENSGNHFFFPGFLVIFSKF